MAKTTSNNVGTVPAYQHPRSVVSPRCQRVEQQSKKGEKR